LADKEAYYQRAKRASESGGRAVEQDRTDREAE
jgi:hypothetical protein